MPSPPVREPRVLSQRTLGACLTLSKTFAGARAVDSRATSATGSFTAADPSPRPAPPFFCRLRKQPAAASASSRNGADSVVKATG